MKPVIDEAQFREEAESMTFVENTGLQSALDRQQTL